MSEPKHDGLPLRARVGILVVLTALLVYNVATNGDPALSLLIAGGLFAAIGLDQNARRN